MQVTNPFQTTLPHPVTNWFASARRYHLQTQGRVIGNIENVARLLQKTDGLSNWWPQFLESETLGAGEVSTQGRTVRVITKGWLPYKLRFHFHVIKVRFPDYFCLRAEGDFEGLGRGRLWQDQEHAVVDFDWNIRVHKPLLHRWSVLLKPLFIHNHRWLMAQGETYLKQLLAQGDTSTWSRDKLQSDESVD